LKLVLDTNVVIDWLVFDDPFLAAFRQQVLGGKIVVITHEPAIVELRRVLGYKELKLDTARQASVLERYEAQTTKWMGEGPAVDALLANSSPQQAEAFAQLAIVSAPPLPRNFPRCRDADDNHFLELAWRAGADALVSRDNAVLKLARRAQKHGFQILNVPQMTLTVAA
jgi:predicted nucleic acid-binding protein